MAEAPSSEPTESSCTGWAPTIPEWNRGCRFHPTIRTSIPSPFPVRPVLSSRRRVHLLKKVISNIISVDYSTNQLLKRTDCFVGVEFSYFASQDSEERSVFNICAVVVLVTVMVTNILFGINNHAARSPAKAAKKGQLLGQLIVGVNLIIH